MQVLQQGIAQHVVVGCLPYQGRNRFQTEMLRRTQPPLPGDEFEAVAGLAHHDRLEESHLGDRGRQLGDRFRFEHRAGLFRIGNNSSNLDFA